MALDLKHKLARLAPPVTRPETRPSAEPGADDAHAREPFERIARIREALARLETRRKPGASADERRWPAPPPGETVMTAHGPLHRIARVLEPHHRHGCVPIARALDASPAALAALALDPALASVDPRRALLLDTETTGLSGGTGTLPFLVGMAFFENDRLHVEQLLLRRPGEERPMLARLAERLAAASCLVTYNGKAFDWPLLRTRAVLNRVPLPAPAAHLDLLHCARRVFSRRLGQVRLVQIEADVLGMHREHDVDGADIPQLYWQFVRDGSHGSMIAPVIEHNANDLVALAALLPALAERWEQALPTHEPEDHLGIAKLALRAGDVDRAARFAQAAARAAATAELRVEALLLASRALRGQDDAVAAMLRRALDAARTNEQRAAIHLALAKHLEHRARDPDAAMEHARRTASAEGEQACARRIARLDRKRARRVHRRDAIATVARPAAVMRLAVLAAAPDDGVVGDRGSAEAPQPASMRDRS